MTPSFNELSINVWDDPASNGNPLLLYPKVRAAMEYAVDRDKIIEMAYRCV